MTTLPWFDGMMDTARFVVQIEEQVASEHRVAVLDLLLAETPTRWCAAHKEDLCAWEDTVAALRT